MEASPVLTLLWQDGVRPGESQQEEAVPAQSLVPGPRLSPGPGGGVRRPGQD